MLILVKYLLAAARNDVAFVESVFPFKEKKRNLTSPCYTGIFSQAPWKEKCYNRSSRAIDVDAVDLSIGVDAVDHFFISYLARVCH